MYVLEENEAGARATSLSRLRIASTAPHWSVRGGRGGLGIAEGACRVVRGGAAGAVGVVLDACRHGQPLACRQRGGDVHPAIGFGQPVPQLRIAPQRLSHLSQRLAAACGIAAATCLAGRRQRAVVGIEVGIGRAGRGAAAELAITRQPKPKQRMVSELIDSVIVKTEVEAQHATG